MADFAQDLPHPVPAKEAAAVQAARAMLWRRILVRSSIIMMLGAAALVLRAF